MMPGRLSSYSDLELALMILLGVYGNGAARKQALGSRYTEAQKIVDFIVSTSNIPDGSGADQTRIKKAIMQTFYNSIDEVTKEVMENLK